MHILLLDPFPLFDFETLGHQTTHIHLVDFETPLETVLAKLTTPPDCIVQMETLATRHFVSGLETAPCPTVFFSFDTHLNMFWHRHYARLFDAVATPHVSLFADLPAQDAIRHVFRLPHVGTAQPWKPHKDRGHAFSFCGRRNAERPLRGWMLDLLERRLSFTAKDGLSFDAMMALYLDTRAVPNEAICFEVNCRLFETASAGAVPLTADCGPDQEAVFTPGREIFVYADGLDLLDKAGWLAANPEKAETMGRAAWERVQREHLPLHRAEALLAALPGITQARASGCEASLRLWLTYVERMKAADMGYPLPYLIAQSDTLPQEPQMFAGLLNLLALPSRKEQAFALCRELLERNVAPASGLCGGTASAAALLHGDFPLARTFWKRFCQHAPGLAALPCDTPLSLCLAWAENETREGRTIRPGFAFSTANALLPACAFEFAVFGEEADTAGPGSPAVADTKLALLERYPAYLPYRLRLMQKKTASVPNWRNHLETAALSLQCCLVDEGALSLSRAFEAAENTGEVDAFFSALAASPARGYSLRDTSSL